MARRARLVIPGVPLHIIQRGNNRQSCFFSERDYLVYLRMLHACAVDACCAIHAYVLMTNHVHLLITPDDAQSPGVLMKALGQRYVQYVNRRYGRTGSLWEGRFRSCIVDDEQYLFICQCYVELNPVRAGMVDHPGHYVWSSYRANAEGAVDALVTPHHLYMSIALDSNERQKAYRDLFEQELPSEQVEFIRRATNGNFAVGDMPFIRSAADVLAQYVTPRTVGRPRRW